MTDIMVYLACLRQGLDRTTLGRLSRVTEAMLAMTGRVTMLGLSRWAGTGGSYRTIQRWFSTTLPWLAVFVCFFRQRLFRPGDLYILAGDEVVVTKAGKQTFGLDRFFSSIFQKPVPGLAFFGLSLVSTTERCAFPVAVEQVVRTPEEKAARQAKKQAKASATLK